MRKTFQTMKVVLALLACMLLSNAAGWAQPTATPGIKVDDLRVEYLRNPIGIDVEQPRFSWKMDSPDRGVSQKAYQIKVSTSSDGSNPIWDSGQVTSDKSVHILYGGTALAPATRYYWSVDVWNQDDEKTSSLEIAYFETGLKDSGWDGAKWIKATTKPLGEQGSEDVSNFSYEVKFNIESGAAGPIFSSKDRSNFFMWQISTATADKTLLRPHVWRGNGASLGDIDITDKIHVENGTEYTLRIDIEGDIATTYINDIEVNVYQNPDNENYAFGNIGFRSGEASERCYYDDVKITTKRNGITVTLYEEDFSDAENNPFTSSSIVDGKLYSNSGIAWQKTDKELITKYTLEMDFEIVDVAAGPIFGAKDTGGNFFMWQINIDKGSADGKTYFRPHSWQNGGGANHEDKDITDLISIQKDQTYRLRIEIDGDMAVTYIDGIKIDERQNPRGGNYGYGYVGLGFRADMGEVINTNEKTYYDNIVVKTEDNTIFFEEDFSNENNFAFTFGTVVDGRLFIEGRSGSNLSWQREKEEEVIVDTDDITKYNIEMDFEITEVAFGPLFAVKDQSNYFMWQINLEKKYTAGQEGVFFRPHVWQNGGVSCVEEKNITDLIDLEKGTVYKLRIEIDGDMAKTYIDNILIDERQNPRSGGGDYGYGKLGFRAAIGEYGSRPAEEYHIDNMKITADVEGQDVVMFEEYFSNPLDFPFTAGNVVDGRLHIKRGESDLYSWQKESVKVKAHFDLEVDLTLENDNAGIIFSAKDKSNFYMWAINTHDRDNEPLVRRHYYQNGSPNYSDTGIGAHYTKAQLLNTERHVKIEVNGSVVKMYIDDVLVDTYNDTFNQLTATGYIGFRAYFGNNTDERAYYDNIVLTDYSSGEAKVLISENFEGESCIFGDDAEIVKIDETNKLHMYTKNGDKRLFDGSADGIPMFRTEFGVEKEIKSAKIYTSGLGIYDVFINGERVGRKEGNNTIYDEFKPGWTDYYKTVFYSTYDVTHLLQQGVNAIGAQVSSGWWQGAVAFGKYGNPNLGFIAKLVIEYNDNTTFTVVTDPSSWASSTNGPIRVGEIYAGESYDARKESDWTKPNFDDSEWFQSAQNTEFTGKIKAFVGPTVQVRPELERTPITISKYTGITANGTTHGKVNTTVTHQGQTSISLTKEETAVYDMGQNMVGWVKFKVKGAAGTKIRIRFAEMLNDSGQSSRGDDGPEGSLYLINLRNAKATLYYTLKGDPEGEEFNPSMTFFGFRYCDLTTTGDIDIDYLKGEVVGSVTEEGSTFTTSHSAVNQLYSNVMWGQRSNFLSIPTDCPQRDERLGWTGDIQVFGRAATYNADIAGFFHKWMGDMRDSQRADGAYPDVAPHAWVGYGQSAWAEAGLVVPWITYLMYDDIGILEENFESMEKYMGFLAAQAGGGYKYNGAGTNYGDWVAYVGTDGRYISVCFYAYSALLMEKMSKAMSKEEGDTYALKAVEYRELYEAIKEEFGSRYLTTRGALTQSTQTAHLLALKLDLFPTEEYRTTAIARLNTLLKNNGNKLNTGFVGTGILNQTLSEVGLTDMAYNLLLQRNNPSWLYSVDQGATTIWERWNSYTKESGFHPDISMNSFNHYAYGAVSEWMYRYMAGINPDENTPGFKKIIIAPQPDFRASRPAGQDQITKVDASYNSYYGAVKSAWEINNTDNIVRYDITIPANTTATVVLPLRGEFDVVKEGGVAANEANGVVSYKVEDGKAIMEVASGVYSFTVQTVVSIENINPESNFFHVYPNPVEKELTIESDSEIRKVQLFNNIGSLIYSQESGEAINMDGFQSGVYFLKVEGVENAGTVKVIKK